MDTTREQVENDVIDEDESDAALLEKSKRMYREYILDHYTNPRNNELVEEADGEAYRENPMCGDTITATATTADNTVEDIGFDAAGCAISIAAASIVSTQIKDGEVGHIQTLDTDDVQELLGVELTPTRLKCALLGLRTMQDAVADAADGDRP